MSKQVRFSQFRRLAVLSGLWIGFGSHAEPPTVTSSPSPLASSGVITESPSSSVSPSVSPSSPRTEFSISEKHPEALTSLYTERMIRMFQSWPPKSLPQVTELKGGYYLRAVRTPEDSDYVGAVKRELLQASMQRVHDLIYGFDSYRKMFPDIEDVKVLSREGNKLIVRFVRKSPNVLVPTIRYDMLYVFDRSQAGKIFIRYQLIKGNTATRTDGLIVLESLGPTRTLLTAWDFYHAHWGIIKTIAPGKIWSETLKGHYLGDLTFRARAENPTWTTDQINEFAEKELDASPLTELEPLEKLGY
jgi:hypothetical protein